MKLLLDTHVFMWWNSEPERIPTDPLGLLQDPNHNLFLSLVSLWEMQIKIQLGKLTLREDLEIMVQYEQERNNLSLMALTLPVVKRTGILGSTSPLDLKERK